MKDIDEFYAGKCGVETKNHGGYLTIKSKSKVKVEGTCFWSIQDPRCRAIIREWLFEQGYVLKAGKALWAYSKLHKDYEAHKKDFHSGKDEVACLEAIYEAEK